MHWRQNHNLLPHLQSFALDSNLFFGQDNFGFPSVAGISQRLALICLSLKLPAFTGCGGDALRLQSTDPLGLSVMKIS